MCKFTNLHGDQQVILRKGKAREVGGVVNVYIRPSVQVILLRSLFTYVRILPAYKMFKACKVRNSKQFFQANVSAHAAKPVTSLSIAVVTST